MLDSLLLGSILAVTVMHFGWSVWKSRPTVRQRQVSQALQREVVSQLNNMPEGERKNVIAFLRQNPGMGYREARSRMEQQ
jgi:predicted negative regulator of RcsB-dependent stress response